MSKKSTMPVAFKLKPFNLKKALGGIPIITREGIPVYGIHQNLVATTIYKYVFFVGDKQCSCTSQGVTHFGRESITDLFIKG